MRWRITTVAVARYLAFSRAETGQSRTLSLFSHRGLIPEICYLSRMVSMEGNASEFNWDRTFDEIT
jgi:hypothetical protein